MPKKLKSLQQKKTCVADNLKPGRLVKKTFIGGSFGAMGCAIGGPKAAAACGAIGAIAGGVNELDDQVDSISDCFKKVDANKAGVPVPSATHLPPLSLSPGTPGVMPLSSAPLVMAPAPTATPAPAPTTLFAPTGGDPGRFNLGLGDFPTVFK